MTLLVIHPAESPLRGSVPVPSDKSIGHRALLVAALASGTSRLRAFSGGEDNLSTVSCLRALGVAIDVARGGEVTVRGRGLAGLEPPASLLDCGNSGTTMRLLSGILAAQPFRSVLQGDESLSRRPMGRVVAPLRARGAAIEGRPWRRPEGEPDVSAPLVVGPLPRGERLTELSYESLVPSAQVKSAVLLSGLYAEGPTYFKEPFVSRDHTERLLVSLGLPIETTGPVLRFDPSRWEGSLPPLDLAIPGDLSAAAFMIAAAQLVVGSQVTLRNVGVNPTRSGFLEMARDMGAGLSVESTGELGGEPVAEVHAWPNVLRAGRFGGEVVARAIDEIPILCALAARAAGETAITDAAELRVKESDRLAAVARLLRGFGVGCEERREGLEIEGSTRPLRAADIDSEGDHRIAMTAAVLALTADAPSVVRDVDCVQTSYPKFVATLRALGARIEVKP
jgi:3-phosphoshikimate 1-carboxyvinyltransferase